MTGIKQILNLLIFLLASVGVAGCIAALCGAWFVGARLGRTSESFFKKIDASVVIASDRVAQVQQRVKDSRITAEEIEQSLADWTKLAANQRVATRVGAEEKVKRIAQALDQADRWLENSASSVELVQQALEIGNSTGASLDTELVDRLLTESESLRTQLAEAAEFVARIRDSTDESKDEKSLEARMDQAIRLALRVVAALGSIDTHLEHFERRMSDLRDNVKHRRAGTLRWILSGSSLLSLLALWMAAGQVALSALAWRRMRHSQLRS